jgi:hypothetical protein
VFRTARIVQLPNQTLKIVVTRQKASRKGNPRELVQMVPCQLQSGACGMLTPLYRLVGSINAVLGEGEGHRIAGIMLERGKTRRPRSSHRWARVGFVLPADGRAPLGVWQAQAPQPSRYEILLDQMLFPRDETNRQPWLLGRCSEKRLEQHSGVNNAVQIMDIEENLAETMRGHEQKDRCTAFRGNGEMKLPKTKTIRGVK